MNPARRTRLLPGLRAEVALPLLLLVIAAGSGCATGPTRQFATPRYTLTMPELWQVKSAGPADGQATTVTITSFGESVVEPEPGALGPSPRYEPMQATVELRIYAWSQSAGAGDSSGLRGEADEQITSRVARLLGGDQALQLRRHVLTPEQPAECGRPPRTYNMLGLARDPLDVISQPGWRTIIVGAKAQGSLVGVIARVPNEADRGLYCHNLGNMQAQLQLLLDGLVALPAPSYVPPPAPTEDEPALDTRPSLDM